MLFKNGNVVDINKEFKTLHIEEPVSTDMRKILRTNIMGYELGHIQQFTNNNAHESLDSKTKKVFEGNAKLGMADLIAQCRMLCLDCGWDFDDIQLMGLDHLKERHDDFKKIGWGEENK